MKRIGWISLVVAVLTTAPGLLLAQTDAPDARSTGSGDSLELPGRFSSTVAFTNDYAFRGVSQSDEDVAIQASLDWSHPSGFYAGFWSSNVDFFEPSAQIELDVHELVRNSLELGSPNCWHRHRFFPLRPKPTRSPSPS